MPFSVDNSEYMRNGDFIPTRLQAQQDAVNLVTQVSNASTSVIVQDGFTLDPVLPDEASLQP